ncbi:MAG: hypothetical protein ACJA2W_001696 [Planctomycetota bacterium]|jgi:hypothetical protein
MTHSQIRRFAVALTGLAALAPLSNGQIKLIEEGDPIPGVPGEVCTRIDDVAVNSLGDWALRVDHGGATSMDECIIVNGALVFQQGTTTGLSALGGSTFNFLDSMILTDNGDQIFTMSVRTVAGATETVVYRNGSLLIQQDITPLNAPTLPPGSIWESVSEVWANGSNQVMVGGRTDGAKDCIVKITLDASGAIVTEEVIVIEGVTLPGHPTPIQGLSLNRYRNSINNSGSTLWFVDDDHTVAGGSTTNDSWVYRDTMPLWREGDPMMTPMGSTYGTLSSCELNLNNSGDYVFQGATNGSFNNDVVLVNDTTLIAAEGAPAPGPFSAFTLTTIGSSGGVFLSDSNVVAWFGDWDDSNTDIDSAIFVNDEPLFQEGVSVTLNGDIIDTISNTDKAWAVSDSGEFVIVEFFSITTGDPAFNGAYLYNINGTIGDAYCTTVANSTGVSGELVAIGSSTVANNDLTLVASQLPNNAFGFFIVSQTQGFSANPGGSAGNICLAGSVGRSVGGVIANTGMTGGFSAAADLAAMPQPNGPVAVMAGETWNFQGWHRDSVAGMATSNFTNGLEITFN